MSDLREQYEKETGIRLEYVAFGQLKNNAAAIAYRGWLESRVSLLERERELLAEEVYAHGYHNSKVEDGSEECPMCVAQKIVEAALFSPTRGGPTEGTRSDNRRRRIRS